MGIFLPLFCGVDLETSNGLTSAARELMMPGEEHAMMDVGFSLCLLVLRPRGSMVLQGSRIMSTPGILRSTPPVHVSGRRH